LGFLNGFEASVSAKNFFLKVEKISYLSREYKAGAVRKRVPLKQGLKPGPGTCHPLCEKGLESGFH